MTRRRSWAATTEELQTLSMVVGLAILIFWAVTGVNPNNAVAALVGSMLVIQKVAPIAQGLIRREQERERRDTPPDGSPVVESEVRDSSVAVDRSPDGDHLHRVRWHLWLRAVPQRCRAPSVLGRC